MKKLYLILIIALMSTACSKNDPEPEKISVNYINISGPWTCVDLKSNLFGADDYRIDKEINNKLNGYTPDLNLAIIVFGCDFIFMNELFHNQRRYSYIIKNDDIIFTVDDIAEVSDEKLRASAYLQGDYLVMTFSRINFENFTWVLGDDYPFNKAMIKPTIAGDVTITFKSLKNIEPI